MNQVEDVKQKFVGKTEEIFLTQYSFDLKIEDLKTATNPDVKTKKVTVHVYSNNSGAIVSDAKKIYDEAVKKFA